MTGSVPRDLGAQMADLIWRVRRLEQEVSRYLLHRVFAWTAYGTLQVGVGDQPLYNDTTNDLTITRLRIAVMPGSPTNIPLGADLVVNVKHNGVPIISDDGLHMVQGTDTAYGVPDEPVLWMMGEYLTVDIVQVGSTRPGKNLVVTVICS